MCNWIHLMFGFWSFNYLEELYNCQFLSSKMEKKHKPALLELVSSCQDFQNQCNFHKQMKCNSSCPNLWCMWWFMKCYYLSSPWNYGQSREHQFKRLCLSLLSFFLKFFKETHKQLMGKGTLSPLVSHCILFADNISSKFSCLVMAQELKYFNIFWYASFLLLLQDTFCEKWIPLQAI